MPSLILVAIILLPLLLLAPIPHLQTWLATHLSHALTLLTHRRNQPKQSHEIVSLRVYPIKSCRGLTLPRTKLLQHGLDLDRRWMIVDATTHTFLTIRQNPRMTLITTALTPDTTEATETLHLSITVPAASSSSSRTTTITIPAHPTPAWLAAHTTLATDIRIWDTTTDGHIYDAAINAPLSNFLGRDVALVYKGPTPRILQGNGAPRRLGREQATNFPDVHPVLLASEASLAELNGRLVAQGEEKITVERFRPNVVVRGEVAWEEDTWKTVRIGGTKLELDVVARCARCQVPNVEPATAVKHKKQPWDTLMAYRRVDEGMKYKPCFGMLSAPRQEGEIAVGMRLEVLEETTKHRYIAGF
ncbi:MOSC domain-containing protein [Aspergillus saccharolyticus JOP 1030-1]|uniref:MOSC-domain-containing protein n=1 Tax=Aspergillus saccharolyticus JOP 1030-1 TaxID=1450539 RepID=A0A318ZKJ0_9EURO|nr:MOSC-domain-containing protein [Aspergillus saccharolyticus JOP 1030-1]PYH44300.1 MOSC-domain-containing protein [Aspergillus saccharolyticus JOP 1030-1]